MGHGGKRENAGRKKGSGYLTEARQKLFDNADEIINSLIDQAKKGDINALKLCIERIVPVAKEIPLYVNLSNPKAKKVEHLEQIKEQVLKGDLSISDAEKQIDFLNKINSAINLENMPTIDFDFSWSNKSDTYKKDFLQSIKKRANKYLIVSNMLENSTFRCP